LFLRDDVYVWLIEGASDRGKDTAIKVQWRDYELLRQLIERRLEAASQSLKIDPVVRWNDIAEGCAGGIPIFDFLAQRCLRRPRSLIDLIELCLSNAALGGREKIIEEDATRAVATYSTDMLRDLNYEIRDVFPDADKVIYRFSKQSARLDRKTAERIANKEIQSPSLANQFIRLMLWFGFLGVLTEDGRESYVFDHGDDLELLEAHAGRSDNPVLCIHPLFRTALSVREDLLL
jgi:hypothetical protein